MESPRTPSLGDSDSWVKRLRVPGDEQARAITELRSFLIRGLRSACGGKGSDESFCEDIAQETVVKVLAKLDQFAGRSRFTTWAMCIGIRLAVSELRKKRFRDVSLHEITGGERLTVEIPAEPATTPHQQVERHAILERLKHLIERDLTDKQRTAIRALLGGMPVEEIAQRLESNRNAVYKLVHDSRQRLKRGMEQAGYSWADIQSAFA